MLIYLIVIFVSFIFAYIGNKTSTKIIRYVFFSLAILLPSLLAGYRDETVGHDILAYAVPCFNDLTNIINIKELFIYIETSGLEPLIIFLSAIAAYCCFPKKSCINVTRTIDTQLALF